MKIVIQYFEDALETQGIVFEGDAIGSVSSYKEAHELIDELERGHTVPGRKDCDCCSTPEKQEQCKGECVCHHKKILPE